MLGDVRADLDFDVFAVAELVLEGAVRDEAELPALCLANVDGGTHRDPQVIPAAMHNANVREDNTLTIYRRKFGPITEISSSARLRTISACK